MYQLVLELKVTCDCFIITERKLYWYYMQGSDRDPNTPERKGQVDMGDEHQHRLVVAGGEFELGSWLASHRCCWSPRTEYVLTVSSQDCYFLK